MFSFLSTNAVSAAAWVQGIGAICLGFYQLSQGNYSLAFATIVGGLATLGINFSVNANTKLKAELTEARCEHDKLKNSLHKKGMI